MVSIKNKIFTTLKLYALIIYIETRYDGYLAQNTTLFYILLTCNLRLSQDLQTTDFEHTSIKNDCIC